MKRKLLSEFRERWKRVRHFEKNEVRNLSIGMKFRQLSSLMKMAIGLRMDFKEDKEKIKIRSRWISLKKGLRRENPMN